jgi:cyclophilin family peptidyl-prolyl cis-trans isomerase
MANNRSQRDRERARQNARIASRQQEVAASRRRRRVVAIVGAVLLLAVVAGTLGARTSDDDTASPSTSSTSTTGSTAPPLDDLPIQPAGEQLTTPTTCPAEDGSSPRVTSFAGPPPMCIDPSMFYEARITTTKGDVVVQLNPEQAVNAVNNFVVLSRYHYYDGQPFTTIVSRQSASVEGIFDNPPGVTSPGYTLPEEVPDQGQVFFPGSMAMIPEPGAPDDGYGGAFLLATFELAPGIPQTVTQFGIMLDGQDVLIALEKASSRTGIPTELISIESIAVRPTIPID